MSHLGDLLSAVVDGELTGAELDKANAHLAACAACRAEAQALRRLKEVLHALPGLGDAGAITGRLLAMSAEAVPGAAGPAAGPGRPRDREHGARQRSSRARAIRPYSVLPPGRAAGRRRGRYVLWSTVSLVVVGIGTAAFGLGGGEGAAEPQITPQLQVFDFQHAIISGDVPFADPANVSPRVPVASARP